MTGGFFPCSHGKTAAPHFREVRTNLSRVLLLIAEPLAHVVNPRLYKGATGLTEFHVRRSHETRFLLHECLPWRVRHLPPGSVEYRLLCRIGERMSECLHSVSRNHLRGILVLFDHLLHDDGPDAPWPPTDGGAVGVDARWAALMRVSPAEWLARYEAVMVPPGRLGVDLWKRHLRFISHFHSRVLHPDTRLYIPVPQAAHYYHHRARQRSDEDEAGWWSTSSFASTAGGPLSDDETLAQRHRRDMLATLGGMRERMCKPSDGGETGRAYAFTPEEVRRLVTQACSTLEQLVVMLFVTTGLRLGGMARLRLLSGGGIHCLSDVPDELLTVEKGNRERRIRPTDPCRLLLVRWFTRGRSPHVAHSPFVFPAVSGGRDHVSPRYIWSVCRGLFQRAGLAGRHVHPHTFRHTTIQMPRVFSVRKKSLPPVVHERLHVRDHRQVDRAQPTGRHVGRVRTDRPGGSGGRAGPPRRVPAGARQQALRVAGARGVSEAPVPLHRGHRVVVVAPHQADETRPGGAGGARAVTDGVTGLLVFFCHA